MGWIVLLIGVLLSGGGGLAVLAELAGTDISKLGLPADLARFLELDSATYIGGAAIVLGLIAIAFGIRGIGRDYASQRAKIGSPASSRVQDVAREKRSPTDVSLMPSTSAASAVDAPKSDSDGLVQVYAFHFSGNGVNLLDRGWHEPESWGVWSSRDEVEICVPRAVWPADRTCKLELELVQLVGETRPPQSIEIVVATNAPQAFHFGKDEVRKNFSAALSSSEVRAGFSVKIRGASVISPIVLGVGNDERLIGLGLTQLTIVMQE